MYLPNRTEAFIPPEKITDYLLSQSHVVGRSKARFFRAQGFDEKYVAQLEEGLLLIAQNYEVAAEKTSAHGTKYVVRGKLQTPSGSKVAVETVWIIEAGEHSPRLVTAYPAKR